MRPTCVQPKTIQMILSFVVSHCLHDTVMYLFFFFFFFFFKAVFVMRSGSFIIILNAVVSGSVEELELLSN